METEKEVQKLTFYIAVIVYESSSDSPSYQKLFEENYVLVKASSSEDARQKALQLAQKGNHTYKNVYQENITWTLKHIVDVSPVLSENFEHGSELFTRFFRNYQAYVAFEPFFRGDSSNSNKFIRSDVCGKIGPLPKIDSGTVYRYNKCSKWGVGYSTNSSSPVLTLLHSCDIIRALTFSMNRTYAKKFGQ